MYSLLKHIMFIINSYSMKGYVTYFFNYVLFEHFKLANSNFLL